MPFFVKVGEVEVSSADLPMSLYADVAKAAGVGWYDLYATPAADPVAGPLLVKAVAKHLNVDAPAEPMTPKTLFACFRFVSEEEAEQLPTSYRDGLPSPEAAPTTA